MSAFKVVIPARYGSARLPGKPLKLIGGTPMVVRVAQRARLAGADEVIVATDDERIAAVAADAGLEAVMTARSHVSGTDRVWEVARRRADWAEDAVVINLQGDEPLIAPEIIAQLAAAVAVSDEVGMATLCEPFANHADTSNPNTVKVVRDAANFALYFSRASIPHLLSRRRAAQAHLWRRHIGLYAYRISGLRRFVDLPPSALEDIERLEQLRALEHGLPILVLDACRPSPKGVDTPADLARVRRLVEGATSPPS
ncbi:MAG: 3-deoxy-manno-octulosonate cytidylyltransferase [Gammaproteobacteria bacterium]|nr:3-deoxy-manno-octulosonate cytidylyltransferase [Gammaproteobacteria bacterium]MCY4342706.1 3-deoxy-manno-octulosonate cytidylyltransferase [Gammaproteobacteria bacterium]